MDSRRYLVLFITLLLKAHNLFSVINVTDTASLIAAINTANAVPETILFSNNITLTAPLPAITNTYTIDGGGNILDGGSSFRGFLALGGGVSPTVTNITIQNTLAKGGNGGDAQNRRGGSGGGGLGAGGAIYVGNGANVAVDTTTYSTCIARGGDTPFPAGGASSAGGGGGGLGGNGGRGAGNGGGGGGGGLLSGNNGANGVNNFGGAGGANGGGDGADENPPALAGAGTYGGGGGGAADRNNPPGGAASADGGFGGGGGGGAAVPGGNANGLGSDGGYGAGGGGAGRLTTGGTSFFGGGDGLDAAGNQGGSGGGGAALGGAIFIDTTSTLTLTANADPFTGSSLIAGVAGGAGNNGQALGTDIFLASGGTLTFTVPAGTFTLSNAIEGDQGAGGLTGGGVVKQGVGILDFTSVGAQTYIENTTFAAGTIRASSDTNLGVAANGMIFSGGTFNPTSAFTTTSRAISLTTQGTIEVDAAATFTIPTAITGAGGLTKDGSGTLLLTGVNTYAGGTTFLDGELSVSADNNLGNIAGNLTFNGGTLLSAGTFSSARGVTLTGAGTIEVDPAEELTLSGILAGAGGLTKTGAGQLTLTGANTYTGGTTVTAGTLQGNTTSLQGNILNNSALIFNQTVDGIYADIVSGTGSLEKIGAAKLTMTGANTYSGGTTVTAGTLEGDATSLQGNILNNSAVIFNQTVDGTYSGAMSGTGSLEKVGAAKLTITGANTYSGGTTITAGTLEGNSTSLQGNILNNSALIFDETVDGTYAGIVSGTGSLEKIGVAKLTLTGANTYSGGTTVTAGTLQGNTTSLQGNILNNSALIFDQTVDGIYADIVSGTGSVEKIGAAKLTVTGANVYSGGTTVTAGELQGNTTSLQGNILNNSALIFNQTVDGVYADIVSGTGSVEKIGAAKLTLTGANVYSGGTTVTAGTLEGDATSLQGNIVNNSAVIFNQTVDGTYSGAMSGTGSLEKIGAAKLTVTGANTYSGGTTITAGTLEGNSTSLQGNIVNNATLIFDQIVDGTYTGVISGTGSFEKIGAAKLTVTGANTYSGGTTLLDGVLSISADNNLGNAVGTLTFNGGALLSTGTFSSNRGVSLTGAGTIEVDLAEELTLSGILSGAGGLTKTGGGQLTLTGANTYAGGTTVTAGTLQGNTTSLQGNIVNNADLIFNQAVDGTFASIVSGTGSLEKIGVAKLTLTGANTYSGGTTVTAGTLEGNTTSLQGNIVNNAAVIFNQTVDGTYAGAMSGTGSLEKVGAAKLTVTGANTYSGGTTITAGTLEGNSTSLQGNILNNSALIFNQAVDGTYAGVVSGTGSLEKTGAAKLTVTGANTYTGGTTVTAGTLQGNTTSLQGNIVNNAAVIFDQLVDGTYVGAMSGTGNLEKIGVAKLTMTGANTYSGGTTVTAGILEGNTTSLQGNILNNAAVIFNQTVDGIYAGAMSGTGSLEKIGAAKLTMTGANTYSGGTTITAGTLEGNATSLQGNIVNNAAAIFNQTVDGTYAGAMSGTGSLEKIGAAKLTVTGTNTYSGGTTITAGTLEGNATSLQGNIVNNAALIFNQIVDGTYAGVISGTGSLEKTGAAKLTVTGANTYTGGTTVTAGILEGNTTSLQGNILNNAAVIFDQAVDGIYAGAMSGTGSLEKTGVAKLTLTGANTYSGGTTITAGTLEGDSTSLQGDIFNNAALIFNQTVDGIYAGVLSGTGSVEKIGAAKLTLTGANTYSGGTIVTAGELQGNTTSLQGNILNNSAVIFNQAVDGTYAGVMSGTGSLEKVGAAKLTVTGANTYSGGTTITAGILEGNATSLQGNILNNSALIFNQAVDGTYAGVVSGTGSFEKIGAAKLTITGANTYTGGTTVTAGTLEGNTTSLQGNIVNNAALIFDQTVDGAYADIVSGTGSLEKIGGAKLTLTGANTYTGGTTVTAGTLEGNTTSLQGNIVNNAALIFDQVVDGTFIDVVSGTGSLEKIGVAKLTLTGANTYSGGTTVTAGTLEGNVTSLQGNILNNSALIFNQAVDGTYAGVMSGTGSLEKVGAAKLTVTGANTYSGGTTITAGILEGNATSLQGNILNNSALIFNQAVDGTYAGVVSGTGSFEKIGAAKLTITGANTYTGGTTVTAGTLEGNTTSLQGNIVNNAALIFDQTVDGVYADIVSGTGSLEKIGGAKLTLTGVNTYTGGTTVTAGTLQGNTTSLQGNIVNNSALIFDQLVDGVYADIVSGTGSVEKIGAAKLTLTGANTYSGGTIVTAGELQGNTTSLQGNIVNNAAVIFDQVVNGTFSGVTSGTGSIEKIGAGKLTLTGTNTYSGGTTITAGTIEGDATSLQGVITNNAALIFDQAVDATYAGVVSGSGIMEKTGIAKLTLTGNSAAFAGPTTITQGSLCVNGVLSGDMNVDPGGLLCGIGQVGETLNDGMVFPGASIGTLTINGNYTQTAAGLLEIELDEFGNSDQLIVLGDAFLDGGITIIPMPGIYMEGDTYTVITTTGNVFGTFATEIQTPDFGFSVGYNASSVVLFIASSGVVTPIPISSLSGNARAVAKYLFCPEVIPTGDLFTVMNALVLNPADEFVDELNQLSPAQFGALPIVNFENAQSVLSSLTNTTEGNFFHQVARGENITFQEQLWLQPIGYYYNQNGVEHQLGFKNRTYGFALGGDYIFNENFIVGGGAGYTYSHLNWAEDAGEADINSIYLGPHLAYIKNKAYVNLSLIGGRDFYDVTRHIHFPGIDRNAANDHRGWEIIGRLETSVALKMPNAMSHNLFFQPYARIDYANVFEGGYQESGANSIDLLVQDKTTSFLGVECTASLFKIIYTSVCDLFPRLTVGWIRRAHLSNPGYTSEFYGQNLCQPNFTVKSFHQPVDQLLLGGDITGVCGEHFEFGIGYSCKMGDSNSIQKADARVQWNF
ncbi:MAG: autotransporter-associated beta strand repeat-containing protein [Candidatus Algichlamydia australiensis]|nr:autotransporter-associated beta strand repeat-containing protein [Chlamydiales bacterium]